MQNIIISIYICLSSNQELSNFSFKSKKSELRPIGINEFHHVCHFTPNMTSYLVIL
jgi:hypothetical protein